MNLSRNAQMLNIDGNVRRGGEIMTLTRRIPSATLARAVLHVRVALIQSSQVSRCLVTPVIMNHYSRSWNRCYCASVGSHPRMFNGPRGLSDTEAPVW